MQIDVPGEMSRLSETDEAALADDILAYGFSALILTYLPKHLALRLLRAGLPIVQLSVSELEHPQLIAFEDYYESALMAGQFAAGRLHGQGNVLVVGGMYPKDGEGGHQRLEGITEAFRAYPDLRWTHVATPWSSEKAYPVIQRALEKAPEPPHGIIGISDPLVLAARDAAAKLGRLRPDMVLVGINGDPLALAAVAEGSITATIDTDVTHFGAEAVDAAYALIRGEPAPRSLSIHSTLVTIDTVREQALCKLIAIADIPSRLVGINWQAEQKRREQLELVASINQQVGGLLTRKDLLTQVAKLIRKYYLYNEVYIYAWNAQGQQLRMDFPTPESADTSCIPLAAAGFIGEVVRSAIPIFIPNVLQSLLYAPDANHPRTRSRAILPIRFNQTVVGVLDLHSSRQVQHLRHELLGLQLLADQVGIAGENARLYEESIQAQVSAQKADRLKTLLLANVSHELRTPLNLILGYGQILLDKRTTLGMPIDAEIAQIHQSGRHLLSLINDLLEMSRLDIDALNIEPEILEARAFLEDVFQEMAENHRNAQVEWRLELSEKLPLIQADPVRLRQILHNLLGNAKKYTAAGQITLGAEIAPPYLHLWVQDTGSGISPEDQMHIFEPFFSVRHPHQQEGGIGLGLSITRRLVALHNGVISLESQLGTGSTFHVYLPLPGLNGHVATYAAEAIEPVILYISHQPEVSPALEQLSVRLGYQLERIDYRLEQFSYARHPALIVWDMERAHPDDWSTISRLRQMPHLGQVPFVVLHQHLGSAGLTNILVKPISQATLLKALETLRPSTVIHQPMMVVDDDPQSCAYYTNLLQAAFPGVTVITAVNGEAALEQMQTLTPSLIILDLLMPKVDGFTVLETMRRDARLQQVPVLVMSGKVLTEVDARRLDFAKVVFHSKDLLTEDEAVVALRNSLKDSERLPQPTSALVKRALVYLHQNYATPFSRQQIARAVGVSERYLSEIFKQEVGLSPWEVLNRFRIQRACELLKLTTFSITEIAFQVGFEDSSYFGRVFHQQSGMSPKKYRHMSGLSIQLSE
jgi:signal transduction histidine kinase/AraC-like DNA-binding protein/DNA-binding LacI/PurR family transcriptional regulator